MLGTWGYKDEQDIAIVSNKQGSRGDLVVNKLTE
jgi:hypothetical protein